MSPDVKRIALMDVTPCVMFHDIMNGWKSHIISARNCSKRFASGMTCANIANTIIGQFGKIAGRATSRIRSSLGCHVSHVHCVRSEKEMGDVNTCGIVATMTNKQSYLNRAMVKFPRESVCIDNFAIQTEHPMTKSEPGSCPIMASVWI